MDGCEWREHDGVAYLFLDLGTQDEATLLARLAAAEALIADADGDAPVRILVEVGGVVTTPRFVSEAKLANRRTFGPRRCRVALTGANALITVIARGWSSVGGGVRANAWPTQAAALRYLTGGGDGQALAG